MMSIWSWLADAVLIVLLSATLVMAVRLDRALRVVRRDRAVFEALISNLGSATNSVKLGIQALRNEADRAAEQIERRTEDADKLATDLSFLIEAAERAGARLEEGRLAKPAPKPVAEPVAAEAEPPAAPKPAPARSADVAAEPAEVSLRQVAGLGKRRRARAVSEVPA